MWSEFKNKIIIKDAVKFEDVDFSFGSFDSYSRCFVVTILEKLPEPKSGDYDDVNIICTFNRDSEITGWFKIVDKIEYKVNIKEESYIQVAKNIANEVAKKHNKQFYYNVSSTVNNTRPN